MPHLAQVFDRTHSPADVRDFIARSLEQWHAGLGPNAAIWLGEEIVGAVGSHRFDLEHRNCSIGYWVDAGRQGKGIVTRCATSLLNYLIYDVGLHRITIHCGTGNHRSCAIPDRLGFTREGVLREAEWVNDRWVDLVVWGMLANDWPRASSSSSAGDR